ncbi:MAG: cupin domain-containing protein [Verrucomicrobiales bacterium]
MGFPHPIGGSILLFLVQSSRRLCLRYSPSLPIHDYPPAWLPSPFTTKDGSTIRSLLDRTNAPVQKQSLAEARLPTGGFTQRHYHRVTEEFYFIEEGTGTMEIDGQKESVGPGDAILIPAGAWHQITAGRSSPIPMLLRPSLFP